MLLVKALGLGACCLFGLLALGLGGLLKCLGQRHRLLQKTVGALSNLSQDTQGPIYVKTYQAQPATWNADNLPRVFLFRFLVAAPRQASFHLREDLISGVL